MSDISLVKYTNFIPITKIELQGPATLAIEGKDVTAVSTVFINGESTKEFVVLSRTRVIVDIPGSQLNAPISTVKLAGDTGEVGFISFLLNSKTEMTDSRYVTQRFFRYLLMTPGSDIYNPTHGTGILDIMGNISFEDAELYLTNAVRAAESFVVDTQTPDLPDSKTLRMVNIVNVSYSINTLTTAVSLEIVLADGARVDTSFNVAGY